ncbi:MAG: hypothetical protein J1F03_03680 [Oscillospiraceae bacterium]|nr:hypothetical protein [Oscillospiraceae bacterium]
MRTLKLNLKIFYCSIWCFILLTFAISVQVFVLVGSAGFVGEFTHSVFSFNIFLLIFVSAFSVYVVHGTREAEYGLLKRHKLIFIKYISVVVFSLSSAAVFTLLLIGEALVSSVPLSVVIDCFLYYFISTFAEIAFIAALSFGIAFLINNKSAYIVSVIVSMLFSPIIESYIQQHDGLEDMSLLNLINLTYDDTTRIRYSGFGMTFNSENILCCIITVIAAVFVLLLVLILKRCFKNITVIPFGMLTVVLGLSIAFLVNQYFLSCPKVVYYNWGDFDGDFVEDPPPKVDTCYIYSDENSPIVEKYDMELTTGYMLKNKCEIVVDMNDNDSIKLRLDECFNIKSVYVNEKQTSFIRNGDYFEVTDIPAGENVWITVEYSGRMNYVDGLRNKSDFCDISAGYLSPIFAWYPKLLTEENYAQDKEFNVSINAVNSFVTNLDNGELHSAGKHIFSKKDTDIFFYMGYLSEAKIDGKRVILPTEFKNNKDMLGVIQLFMFDFQDDSYMLYNFFDHFDGEYRLEGLTEEEQFKLFQKLWLEWDETRKPNDEEANAVDTIIIRSTSYNQAFGDYVYENFVSMSEFSVMSYLGDMRKGLR